MTSSAVKGLPFWNSMPSRMRIVNCVGLSASTLSASPSVCSWYSSSNVSRVSNAVTSRAWSGLVTMFCPSSMYLDPPPVTPRRKFPPRLGLPAAALVSPPPEGDGELPPQAARVAAMATPLAPTIMPRLEGVQRPSEGLGGLSLTCQRCSPESVIGPALHYAGLLGHPPSRWGRAPGVHMMNGGFTCVSSIPRRNERLG